MSGAPVTVIVADDEPHYRSALADLVAGDPRFELRGVADGEHSAIELIASEQPDTALVDVRMGSGGAVAVVRATLARGLSTRVIAISAFTDQSVASTLLGAGAASYVSKSSPPEEILTAIADTAAGHRVVSRELTDGMLEALASQALVDAERRRELARVRHLLDTAAVTSARQPIVRMADGSIAGYEALARFEVDGPDVWFGAARRAGLEVELDLAAIDAALTAPGLPESPVYLSLNAGPRTILSPGFVPSIAGFDPSRLIIEITEHAPVEDYTALREALAPLRANGLRVAVDDAGAGFASLRHILMLEPDIVKLDVGLTQGVDHDRVKRALARGLTSFAREAGITLLAEGIETAAQMRAWVALGVELGQGYFFGAPEIAVA